MFYYPNVLQRHSGCFSTIWLSATRGIKVTRRELLKVNVRRTCGDILDYVTAQVPAPQPNMPRPRFSLYLSSQLQYGVVVVYHRQCGFLLEEVQQTMDRLLRSKRCIHIDMEESDRPALDVPDNLYIMEEAEGAQDPFFGLMELNQLPSPYNIPQQVLVIEEADPQDSPMPSLHTTPQKSGFRASPAAITLPEKAQLHIPTAEYFVGDDLPEVTAREIDLLMDQPEHFREEVEGQHPEERIRDLEGAVSMIDPLKETVLIPERDSLLLLKEETGQPVEASLVAAALEMTPVKVPMPTPPSRASGNKSNRSAESLHEEVVPPLKKQGKGRRRQLIFADSQVQILDRVMQERIRDPLTETQNLTDVLLSLHPLNKLAAPAQLFTAPCGSLLHNDLQSLWKQCATLSSLPTSRENMRGGEEEEQEEEEEARVESEQDREVLRMERKRRQSSLREISSESGLQPAEGSSALDVILDMSKEDKLLNDMITPVSRWSPQEEPQLQMEPIVEENIEMPEAQNDADSRDMLSWISSSLQKFKKVTFDSLVPPQADRSTAAHFFFKLLELLSEGHVTVRQTEAYGVISINCDTLSMTA